MGVHLGILIIIENDQNTLCCVIECQSNLLNSFYIKYSLGPYSVYKYIILLVLKNLIEFTINNTFQISYNLLIMMKSF